MFGVSVGVPSSCHASKIEFPRQKIVLKQNKFWITYFPIFGLPPFLSFRFYFTLWFRFFVFPYLCLATQTLIYRFLVIQMLTVHITKTSIPPATCVGILRRRTEISLNSWRRCGRPPSNTYGSCSACLGEEPPPGAHSPREPNRTKVALMTIFLVSKNITGMWWSRGSLCHHVSGVGKYHENIRLRSFHVGPSLRRTQPPATCLQWQQRRGRTMFACFF